MTAIQICGVCEAAVKDSDIAPNIQPGDFVICRECDKVTPNHWQAREHYVKRTVQWERLKKIEEAARIAFAHLSYLDSCGVLTRKEEPMMQALREALTTKKAEKP